MAVLPPKTANRVAVLKPEVAVLPILVPKLAEKSEITNCQFPKKSKFPILFAPYTVLDALPLMKGENQGGVMGSLRDKFTEDIAEQSREVNSFLKDGWGKFLAVTITALIGLGVIFQIVVPLIMGAIR